MPRIDHVDNYAQEIRELYRRLRDLETATPLSNASVGRGRLRMYDSSELLIEDGNLTISGTASVNGVLVGSGTFTWTGTTNLNGPTFVRDDLTVTSGGKITVVGGNDLEIGITTSGNPGVEFEDGGQLAGTSDGIQLTNPAGNGFVYAGSNVGMSRGSKSVQVESSGVTITAPLQVASLPVVPGGATVYAVAADSSGNLYRRSVSS